MLSTIRRSVSKAANAFRLRGRYGHIRRVERSHRVIQKISEICAESGYSGHPSALAYLSKVDPFVFEEIVLSCFERDGMMIVRNARYTGDGGVDGAIRTPQGRAVLQCKRYSGFISPAAIDDLHRVVIKQKADFGIFAHTGKTSDDAHRALEKSGRIFLLSGYAMVDVIRERGGARRWVRQSVARR